MPFARNIHALLGKRLLVQPHYGNGWMLCKQGAFALIDTPQPFTVELNEVVDFNGAATVLICAVKISLQGIQLDWAAILARSDNEINLLAENTAANIMLSTAKPRVMGQHPAWHPDFVDPVAQPYFRGFGILSLPPAVG